MFTVFNLVNDIDVENVKAQIEAFQRENKETIEENHRKQVRPLLLLLFTLFILIHCHCLLCKDIFLRKKKKEMK